MSDVANALPAGLHSLAEPWREALAQREYELPSPGFERTLINGCAGGETHLDTTALFALRSALRSIANQSDPAQGERLAEALRLNADAMTDQILHAAADRSLAPVTAVYSYALGSTLVQAAAPRRDLLRRIGLFYTGGEKRKNPHVAELYRLRLAADAALLSQDLDLFRAVMGLRKTVGIYPTAWPLMHAIAKAARMVEHNGIAYLRVDSAELRERFVSFWQALRIPYTRDFDKHFPGDRATTGPLVDSYAYGWIYRQTFAAEPAATSDWATLRLWLLG